MSNFIDKHFPKIAIASVVAIVLFYTLQHRICASIILYLFLTLCLVRFFQTVHRWDEEIEEMEREAGKLRKRVKGGRINGKN